MNKRKLSMMLFFLFATLAMNAQEEVQRLVVWQKSGEKVYFDLTEEPKTTFDDGKLVITTNTVQTSYKLSDIVRYTYEGHMPDINPSSITPNQVIFRQGKDMMSFDGLPEGTRIELYSLDGKMLSTQQASSGKTAVVSLAAQPAGIYIVKVNDATYKFMKR